LTTKEVCSVVVVKENQLVETATAWFVDVTVVVVLVVVKDVEEI
jgi:hypothetical protein